MSSVYLKDFQPFNEWKPDDKGLKWLDGSPKFLIDLTTNKNYWNEDKSCIRFKCFLLTLGTPIVHTIASVVNVAFRIVKLVSLSHFLLCKDSEVSYSLSTRVVDAGKDILKIITAPLSLVGLELSTLYGILTPYNGRKLYASIERAQYGGYILAPCFQPSPTCHALGGNPQKKNAF